MRSIKTAVQAEELLLALTSACLQNDQWVSFFFWRKRYTDVSRTPHTDFDYLIDWQKYVHALIPADEIRILASCYS
jgi:vancomycin permeability regulator SanA